MEARWLRGANPVEKSQTPKFQTPNKSQIPKPNGGWVLFGVTMRVGPPALQ
jgi:hypothetical protein